MSEVERLQTFYDFDDDVLAITEQVACGQENISWPEYARRLNIPEPFTFRPKDAKPIEVIDITPKDYDETLVYHLPMGCLLDSNMVIHVATLAQTQFDKRIISVSNPGQPGRGSGKLSVADAVRVWNGNLKPVVAPTLEYLDSKQIESASHIGISYGADKAAAAAENAPLKQFGQEVPRTVMIEPVSISTRGLTKLTGLLRLGRIFQSTSVHGDKYLEPVRARSQAFVSAEKLKESEVGYAIGLARLSNLAVAAALAQEGFEGRLERALLVNAGLKAGLSWGSASEFDLNNSRDHIADRLQTEYGRDRLSTLPLVGQTHAMNLDIFLNAAVISQLVKQTKPR